VGPVDLAVVAVANASLVAECEAAVHAGARSLAILASCHGTTPEGEPIVDRVAAIAQDAGVPVCGFHQPWDLRPGGVAFLTHSGSLFSAMLHNRRHLRFNLVISSGNELATTMSGYVAHAVSLASTRAIGMFLETVRDPETMAAALERAANLDVPVVALKVGRTDRARMAVATHTAALAGDQAAFEAFAYGHGVHLVDTMEELIDTLALFDGGRRATTRALGAVHDSGGERSMLIDTADRVGVVLAEIGEDTRQRLGAVLDPGLEADNPVDAWGTGRDASDVLAESALALARDPAVGAVVVNLDMTSEDDPDEGYGPTVVAVAGQTAKPVAVLSTIPDAVDPGEARLLADAGVPLLRGTESGLRAMRHLFEHPLPLPRRRPAHPAANRWTERLADPNPLLESEALTMISTFGVPVAPSVEVSSPAEAAHAAEAVGYPVAVKAAGHMHKSDIGGVHLNLGGSGSVMAACEAVLRLGGAALVQPMAPPGVEVAFGMIHDPQFGPVVVLGAGGELVELLDDAVTALPHLDHAMAARLLDRLAVRHLLSGFRGRGPADTAALVDAFVSFCAMVASLDGLLGSVDVNPVIVGTAGCVAVDALVVPREG
jgi:acyl-CoA synthetase (NDP forming)